MTTRTIDDPSALGWVQDPSTGRWVWQSSSGGGGEGGTSGPVTTSMVVTESSDLLPWLADPSELRTQKDVNRYLNEKIDTFQETDPTVPDHVKAITNSQIASWDAGTGGGGGSGPDPRITDTQISNWDEAYSWGDWRTGSGGSGGSIADGTITGQVTMWGGSEWTPSDAIIINTGNKDVQFSHDIGLSHEDGFISGSELGTATLTLKVRNQPRLTMGSSMTFYTNIGVTADDSFSLGTASKRLKDGHFAGAIECSSLTVNGQPVTGGGGGGGGFSGSYNDLTDKPTIPTNNTQLTNGMGYVTASVVNGYATQSWVGSYYQPKGSYEVAGTAYTKAQSDAKYELKGQGGGASTDTLADVTGRGATTTQSCFAPNWHCSKNGYTLGGDGTATSARIVVLNGIAMTNQAGAATLQVTEAGVATATDFTASSDRNLKDHIETAPTGVVDKLRGVTFQWKEDGRESSGVIAQEVQDAGLGHLVDENEKGLTVNYNGLVAYLIEEIKDLKAQVEALK